jgi:ribosomal protein L11 methyltransferase
LIRLSIRVRADRAELALAELLPILGGGAEEREVDGAIEYAVYVDEPPPLDEIRALSDAVVEVRTEPAPDGWERRWHEFLRPVRVRDLVVRPPWIDGAAEDLVIDPGVFFGAGTHATTRLCLELLLDEEPGGALCDWGAGTGVLAIAAARLGWAPVTALELEPAAIEVIRANAARNGVEVDARAHDLRDGAPWAPTVVANLPKPVLLEVAAAHDSSRAIASGTHESSRVVASGAHQSSRVIASGMLAGEADEVVAAFGLPERRRLEADGWAAVVLG